MCWSTNMLSTSRYIASRRSSPARVWSWIVPLYATGQGWPRFHRRGRWNARCGAFAPAGGWSRCISWSGARFCRRPKWLLTTQPCRSWIQAAGVPRPDGCGAMLSTTVLGRDPVILPPRMSIVKIIRATSGNHLKGFRGLLQVDGYTGFGGLVTGAAKQRSDPGVLLGTHAAEILRRLC